MIDTKESLEQTQVLAETYFISYAKASDDSVVLYKV